MFAKIFTISSSDSGLLNVMGVELPRPQPGDPVATFQRLLAWRHGASGDTWRQEASGGDIWRQEASGETWGQGANGDNAPRLVTRQQFRSSPLEDREAAWAGSEDWVRSTGG